NLARKPRFLCRPTATRLPGTAATCRCSIEARDTSRLHGPAVTTGNRRWQLPAARNADTSYAAPWGRFLLQELQRTDTIWLQVAVLQAPRAGRDSRKSP